MKELKNYLWLIPFIGVIICIIALLTPAAFFENRQYNHTIYRWIWGFYYDKLISNFDQSVTIESRFFDNPLQLISSAITSTIIIACVIITLLSAYKRRSDLKNGIIKAKTFLIPAILIILSMITWMTLMEIAELQLYDLSMWNRYFPSFGVIGMFLGAGLIIVGFFLVKKNGSKPQL
ncbi:MAG: hypothetical protein ACFFB0_02510 [Promethearchaeota archaeon]